MIDRLLVVPHTYHFRLWSLRCCSLLQVWSPTTSSVFARAPSCQRSPLWMISSPGGRWRSSWPSPSWPSSPERWSNGTAKLTSRWTAWTVTEPPTSSRAGRCDDWGRRIYQVCFAFMNAAQCPKKWEGKNSLRRQPCGLLSFQPQDFCKVTM